MDIIITRKDDFQWAVHAVWPIVNQNCGGVDDLISAARQLLQAMDDFNAEASIVLRNTEAQA